MGSDINSFHNVIDQAVASGFANIQGDVNWLFNLMIVLTIALTALLTWAWGEWDGLIRSLIQRLLLIGFVGYLISNWHSLTNMVVNGMTALGLKAGGSAMSADTFWSDPSQIWVDGVTLSNKVAAVCSSCSLLTTAHDFIFYLVGSICVLIAFGVLSIAVFIATLEFKLVTLASMIFVPFAIWHKTSFLSDRALGYVFSFGAKLLVLALIVAIGEHAVSQQAVSPTPNQDNVASLCFLCFALMILALSAPRLAAALISGGPQLGVSSVVAPAAMIGGAALTAGAGAVVLGRQSVSQYRAATTAMNVAAAAGGSRGDILMAGARGFFNPGSVGGATPGNRPPGGSTPRGAAGGQGTATGGAGPGPGPSGQGPIPTSAPSSGGTPASGSAEAFGPPPGPGGGEAASADGSNARPQNQPTPPAPAKRAFSTGGGTVTGGMTATANAFRQSIPEESGASLGAPDIHRNEEK
jgi:type IV secretion system protein TrbL